MDDNGFSLPIVRQEWGGKVLRPRPENILRNTPEFKLCVIEHPDGWYSHMEYQGEGYHHGPFPDKAKAVHIANASIRLYEQHHP